MGRLRVFASVLSILSLLVAALLRMNAVGTVVLAAVVVAAACLAIVAPFNAPDPPRRKRVFAACLAYVGAMAAAIVLAVLTGAAALPVLWLGALLAFGLGLSLWAFKTRNRRRSPVWGNYYDYSAADRY